MSREIALGIFIPFCIVVIGLLAIAAMTRFKHWQKMRTIERGLTDVVRQVRS